jgi:hypothetical protein
MTINYSNTTNVTGWDKLVAGEIPQAAYEVSNTAMAGNMLLLLYVAVTAVILFRTKNPTIPAIMSMIFLVLFFSYLTPLAIRIMIGVALLSIAGSIAKAFFTAK